MNVTPIIDAHLDLAWNALSWNRDLTEPVETIRRREAGMTDDDARGNGTVSLPEMRRGGVAVCLATLLVRATRHVRPTRRVDLDVATQDAAHAVAQGQLSYYRRLAGRGEARLIGDVETLDAHWNDWREGTAKDDRPVGLVIAMEGADPIAEPAQAEQWFRDGLRVVGLAHYGASHYAVGTGDTGPLTPAGRELLREMDRLGMVLDLTHCAEPGFFEALDHFGGAVLASHNNCRALVPGDRQFSDEQIRRLVERDAVIGAPFDAWMSYPGWQIDRTSRSVVAIEAVVDHIDHICQLAGNTRHVGIGSDLDGGFGSEQVPTGIDTIADLRRVGEILAARGYADADVEAVLHGNMLRLLRRALPPRTPSREGGATR